MTVFPAGAPGYLQYSTLDILVIIATLLIKLEVSHSYALRLYGRT